MGIEWNEKGPTGGGSSSRQIEFLRGGLAFLRAREAASGDDRENGNEISRRSRHFDPALNPTLPIDSRLDPC